MPSIGFRARLCACKQLQGGQRAHVFFLRHRCQTALGVLLQCCFPADAAPSVAPSPPHAVELLNSLFLVDVGEGTRNQLRRMGMDPLDASHIFITHMHGDHCFGLPGAITELCQVSGPTRPPSPRNPPPRGVGVLHPRAVPSLLPFCSPVPGPRINNHAHIASASRNHTHAHASIIT